MGITRSTHRDDDKFMQDHSRKTCMEENT